MACLIEMIVLSHLNIKISNLAVKVKDSALTKCKAV